MENEIQLIIKAPNQNIDDQIVHCCLDWTVLDLKVHLSKVYPSKPDVTEQKLIYCGHLLPDEAYLIEAFPQEDEGQTAVHLVCSKQDNIPRNAPERSGSCSSQNVPYSSASENVVGSPESSYFMGESAGVRQRNVGSCNNENPPDGSVFSHQTLSSDNQNHVPYIQQLYAEYLSQQYPLSNNLGGIPIEAPSAVQFNMANQMAAYQQMYTAYYAQMMTNLQMGHAASTLAVGPTAPVSTAPAVENVNMPAPVIQAQQPNQNAVDGHDEALNRDWLDYFYLCCRGFVLFSVVYFYSSPERLLLVVGLAVMAFLYQEGWLMARNRNNRANEIQPNRQPEPEEHLTENQNDPPTERDVEEMNELEAAMDGDNPPHAQDRHPTNNQNPALTFIMSFFSSLIPEPPPPVNIN